MASRVRSWRTRKAGTPARFASDRRLSHSSELRLRWLAILSGQLRSSLALSGGVHTVDDVVQSVMAGAHAVQVASALLKLGPAYLDHPWSTGAAAVSAQRARRSRKSAATWPFFISLTGLAAFTMTV
jgi:hypothetical protein